MMVASEAEEAWCPPTFRPSSLERTLLAWWIVQAESQRTFFSNWPRRSRFGRSRFPRSNSASLQSPPKEDVSEKTLPTVLDPALQLRPAVIMVRCEISGDPPAFDIAQ